MPIYEYRCECGKVIEAIQRLSDPELACCGEYCVSGRGDGKVSRMLSAHNVARGLMSSGVVNSGPTSDPTCGGCGRAPGSCAYD